MPRLGIIVRLKIFLLSCNICFYSISYYQCRRMENMTMDVNATANGRESTGLWTSYE
jgi:hypothetical protein